MIIKDNWKIAYFDVNEINSAEVASKDYIDHFWIPATVPGDVHSTLINRKIIDNPFKGHNDQKSRWIEKKEWWYRTEFEYKEHLKDDEKVELIFEGLDTFATVFLNGRELGSTDNMFIPHIFEVTNLINYGKNVIAVKFDPINKHVKNKNKDLWSGFSKERVWVRKAQMNFGWDWGPRLVTTGIWKEVHIKKRKCAKIDSVFVKTIDISNNNAKIEIDIDLDNYTHANNLKLEVSLKHKNKEFNLKKKVERNKEVIYLNVKEPKLWWTHDLGEPNLYNLIVKLYKGDILIDEYKKEVGIRSLKLQHKDENGNKVFTFLLNGVKVFAKGANWIPPDSLFGAVDDKRYKNLITMARKANMNMLRVWGGGIYEKDVFYQECNRQGILVWQDFMFACALYPDYNKDFINNVEKEIISVVKKLRNDPCIALWCGNNENDWLYEKMYSDGDIKTDFYGKKIYHELLPGLLLNLDPTRPYWPSSPYGGNDHNDPREGDTHNWYVWHGQVEPRKFGEKTKIDYSVEGVSFKNYKKDISRFVSEFGMHASSNEYTLKDNIPKGQFYWGSPEMDYRNKDYHHQKGILLMEDYTGIPDDIEKYIKYSMLTQAEGLKFGVEHYRRRKPMTSGTLIWQLNDCWPGTSWSMIDYYLLPKASYYYARNFYNPYLISLNYEPNKKIELWVINDLLEDIYDEIQLDIIDFYGKIIFRDKVSVDIKANSSLKIKEYSIDIVKDVKLEEIAFALRSGKGHTSKNIYFLSDQKNLNLPCPRIIVEINEQKDELKLKTDKMARFVTLNLPSKNVVFSDNYFDLLPGELKQIKLVNRGRKKIPYEQLTVSDITGTEAIIK
ncbi:beta-mannosidase [Halothermothrix orenii]|uniref:Beta-mannosidase B n=1 Tax=Halothermothrix orenii (strain H 168 / OCM 544 / DSM 9562) TaxID=373903 RepID=B8CXP2_HALOH|nr:glycoside hydrolase family 2 protein [Halothermothrix orenii]ACL70061.1 beta-mannosidase [Halothermothrix orenii H 168]